MISQFSSSLKKKKSPKLKRIRELKKFEGSPESSSLGVTPKKEDTKQKIKSFFTNKNEGFTTPKRKRFLNIGEPTSKEIPHDFEENKSMLTVYMDETKEENINKAIDELINSDRKNKKKEETKEEEEEPLEQTPRPPKINIILADSDRNLTSDDQNNDLFSSKSDFTLGSLMEIKDEIIKSIKLSKEKSSISSSECSEGSEYHSVFENSELRVRGIDVDNLVDHKGGKIGIFDLFKARFQQNSDGVKSIENKDVVRLIQRFMGKVDEESARRFLNKDVDWKKKEAVDGSNWRTFYNYWKEQKERKR